MNGKIPFCLYFDGELECPEAIRRKSFLWCLWKAERAASCRDFRCGELFLSFVLDFIFRAGLGCCVQAIARYIAQFPFCGERGKLEIARRYQVDCAMEFNRPRGWTVYENLWEDCMSAKFGGLSLYRDGRVYELQGSRFPETSLAYVLVGTSRTLAEEARDLIASNWNFFRSVPMRIGQRFMMERCEYLKFLSRKFEIFLRRYARKSYALFLWSRKVLRLVLKHGFRFDGSLQVDLDFFVDKWSRFMDEMMAEFSRRKLFHFLGPEFAEDCVRLGFIPEGFSSAGIDLELEDNYQLLGNQIYAHWRLLSCRFGDAACLFNPGWFKRALHRLGELGSKGFCKLKPA